MKVDNSVRREKGLGAEKNTGKKTRIHRSEKGLIKREKFTQSSAKA